MLTATATTIIGSIALKDKLNNKKSMVKILIFAFCLPAINALAIWACSQLSLKGASEMTSLTLMIVAAACIFILPELFSKTKSSENISNEEQPSSNLTASKTASDSKNGVITEHKVN